MIRSIRLPFFFALCASISSALVASPFASNILLTGGGTNVSFILNEDADALTYSINGGADVPLTPTKGTHNFAIAPTDVFAIKASKNETGYALPTGATITNAATGLSQPTAESGFRLISDDTANTVKFNSPRGVSVSNNPNAPNFGTAYVSNSNAGTTGGRSLTGRGLYAIRADQTDAFGLGNAAALSAVFGTGSTNSPYKVFAASNGEVYVAGFGDAVSGVWRAPQDLSSNTQLLQGTTGPTTLPVGQNHGSVTATYVTGSSTGGDLTVYTLDEDMTTNQLTRAAAGDPMGTDTNDLWQYNIGSSSLPYAAMPTKIASPLIQGFSVIVDVDRGADGKFYLSENRSQPATLAGLFVLDASGTTVWDSLSATRTLLGNPTANDIFSNVFGMAVSPDQKWLAVMVNDSDVAVLPLVGGIPDIANRLLVNTGTDVVSGRDIAFDAADNIHYVSSGQGLYRVLAPGGQTTAVTEWNGSSYSYSFAITVPEPASCMLMLFGLVAAIGCRRTRSAV